jgi:hypothetical protein
MILLLAEHIDDDDNDDDELLYYISGVFFLGCIHDEKGDNFRKRALWSLMAEVSSFWYDTDAVAWEPVMDWIESITTKFRATQLDFPIRTYHERNSTWITRLEQSDNSAYCKRSNILIDPV